MTDLCFVILESYQIEEAKNVGKLSQELITKWRKLVTSKVIEEDNDHKGEIRSVLREYYPTHFSTVRKLGRLNSFPSVSQSFNGMNANSNALAIPNPML